jgi:tetratricopeptide (TPR) repeat protein
MAVGREPVQVGRASDLHARAVEANRALKPARGLALSRRAARALGAGDVDRLAAGTADPATAGLLARIVITSAKSTAELHGLAAGLAVLDVAELLATQTRSAEGLGLVAGQRGLLYLRFGDSGRALVELSSAQQHLPALSTVDRCSFLLNRGVAYLGRLQLAQATADFAECARIASDAELAVLRGMAEHNRGYAQFLAGDLVGALDSMRRAVQIEPGWPSGAIVLDRARVLLEAGLTREADATIAEAAQILERDKSWLDLAEAQVERARTALVAGDVGTARRLAAQARDRFRRRGNDRWRRTAELVLLQGDLAAGRPGGRLVEPARRLRDELTAVGARIEARTAGLIAVEALLSAGRLPEARALLAEVGVPSPRDPLTARLHAREVRARCHAVSGRGAAAAREARLGMDELTVHQARFGSIDLQTAAAVHGRHLAEQLISIAVAGGRPAAVFAAAERARAVSSRVPLVRPPSDPQAALRLAELRQTVESIHLAGQDPALLATLHRRRRALEREVTSRRWSLIGAGEARTVADIEQVRARLGDAALVSFVQAEGMLRAVVVGAHQVRLHALGLLAPVVEQVRRARADLDVVSRPMLPAALEAAVLASLRRSMAALDEQLLAPLGLDGRRLVVVSTGVLGQLPWGQLPSLSGVPVEVSPSATAWAVAAAARRSRRHQVVALAGPGVASGRAEVAVAGAAWPGAVVHTGAAADRRAVVTALGRAVMLHVAAHGVHQTENPLFSSIRLSDGVLFAHELDGATRAPEHVILSACELGLATVRPGDEGLGLTSVLLRLGTRSVIGGVARVGDQVAAETMSTYHRLLAGGADSAAALAEASATAGGVAPFVCFGSAWTAPAIWRR